MLVFVLLFISLCPFQFCKHLDKEERAGCFALLPFRRLVTVNALALPHGAVGRSAVCNCGIS